MEKQGTKFTPTADMERAAREAAAILKDAAGTEAEKVSGVIAAARVSMTDAITRYLKAVKAVGYPDAKAWEMCSAILRGIEKDCAERGEAFKFAAQVKQNARDAAGIVLRARTAKAEKPEAEKAEKADEVTAAKVVRIVGDAAAAWAKARDNDELLAALAAIRAELAERKVEVPA